MARALYLCSVLLTVLPWSLAVLGHDSIERRAFAEGNWTLLQRGTTGVSGMQLAIVSETTAIIYDKVEHNTLTVNGHVAWAVEVDLNALTVRALNPLSNSWCATGSFLGNGTLINSGGNPVVITGANGLQAIRMFTPCNDKTCDVFEDPNHIHLTSNRWYPSSIRIEDGSIIVYGGSVGGGYINSNSINNPTYEFFPPKNINGKPSIVELTSLRHNGVQIPSQFLRNTLNGNHFPIMIYLPDGTIFVAANQDAMIFNWQANTETALPGIPNGVRVTSPFSAGATLLPLTPENNYTPEVMICGGSTVSDSVSPTSLSSQTPASAQCSRLVLDEAGIAAGWQVERMPQARVMPELVLLPDGRVVIVNGAQTGVAGYGNVANRVGQSNADNPAFTPVVYDPSAPASSRFSSAGIPATNIARLYHSTASLTPNGTIMLAGSNPNNDVTTTKYPTEYRMEFYSPPYMSKPRPTYTGLPATVNYNAEFTLTVDLPTSATNVSVSLMDLGFATHGVHMDQRLLKLVSSLSDDGKTLTVTGPPTARLYPPGPAYLYVVTDEGVPSFGHKTIIGTGASPPVDGDAAANMLKASVASFVAPPPPPAEGEGSNVATAVIPASS
ncbi:glyoxal oxidase N-terminus-domain-containing protein [Armillaria borealis]|uniref:Glyoxal oxidase N-terminus-domain-containing protein n=1 Tax=Armillaria borealis TaxID=47425 RepID=A0AA39JNZ2_9AGAR|nr:glyoxal oxidase N-terminus-domain-containing protein [Armillaria borealis]